MKNRFSFLIYGLSALMLIAFNSCETEEPVGEVALEDYREELGALVSSEIEIVQNTNLGYNVGEIFAVDSVFDEIVGDYLDSLYVAEEIIAIPDVSFEELYYANFAITAAGRRFHSETFIADKRALNDLIGECDTMRVHHTLGVIEGDPLYSVDSAFAVAISEAKIIRNDAANSVFGTAYKRNQRQVDAEVEALDADFTIYKAAIK